MTTAARIREVWQFREVIRNFVSQDIKVKYRRSVLGFFWSLLNPLLMMIVLSVVFATIFNFRGIRHYTLYLFSAMLPWTFFATTVDGCAVSIINNESYLKRQYFPKLVFPLALLGQNLVTLLLSMVVLILTLGWFIGFQVTPALAILPLSFGCLIAFALGLGTIVAVLTVYFRDTQHLVQVGMTAWYFFTPILWPLTMQPESRHVYFKMNPMYFIMEMFRAPIYRGVFPSSTAIAVACGVCGVTFLVGLFVFWNRENDLIFRL